MRALEGNEVERRGVVHGAESSDELGRNSGEQFPRMESLPRTTEVCMGCARGRGSSRQDGTARGELERPEHRLQRWRARWQRSGATFRNEERAGRKEAGAEVKARSGATLDVFPPRCGGSEQAASHRHDRRCGAAKRRGAR
jgi:hypothetical protein